MAFFEGKNMTAGYGKGPDIINSCSINVNKGEIVAILGPNGAGKSTAMKAMLGLLNLKSGSIVLNEKDISKENMQISKNFFFEFLKFRFSKFCVFLFLEVLEGLESSGRLKGKFPPIFVTKALHGAEL